MKKAKYNLSKSSVDRLMDNLTKVALGEADESFTGLKEAELNTAFVKSMTKVKGLDDVEERNDHLSRLYQGFLNMYGFTSMYDMYVYAMSCDLIPEGVTKSKDYSKLVPVKRKIIRNGKETEVTVYEDPNKDNKDKDDDSPKETNQGEGRSRPRHARELRGKVQERKDHKQVAKLKLETVHFPKAKQFKESSDFYLEIRGDEGSLEGVVGYSVKGEYLHMDFYISSGKVSGVATRGLGELLGLALKNRKGVQVEDQPEARPVFTQFGMSYDGGVWSISYTDLQEAFGESGSSRG
ncbi:hypothetical protein BSP36_050 [Bacillus phage BSP36]|nr:hypothetical protein BSP36_050 [Bacillus phage BSP36]